MKNIIKEISTLEIEKQCLINAHANEELILEYDGRINDLTFNVAEYLCVPIHVIGPYLAEVESIFKKELYEYIEENTEEYKYFLLKSDTKKVIIAKEPIYKDTRKIAVYNITIRPSMLSLSLTNLKSHPELIEFLDEFITFQMTHSITDDATIEKFFDIFIQESEELKKIRKKDKK